MIDRSATELVDAMAAGHLSPVEVVDAAIARIEEVNGALNAVVATRYAEARDEARAAERRLRAGERLPLLGVPCTVKEFLAVRGMPHTAGISHRRRVVADRDATVVRRLKAAGAVVLGVTNAPEGGLWPETNNPVHGRTHNPHDLRRTPGGSSGGEAAIVAAGGVPFGIGSDVGGSVRIPAHFCGICSHKPTSGWVPATGHFPHPPGGALDRPMGVGPMARTVADLRRVLGVIAGPDGLDPQCDRRIALDPVDVSGLEVVAMPTNGTFRPTRETEAAVHQAALALVERGARLRPWTGPDLSRGFEQWAAVLAASGETYADLVTREGEAGLARQVGRWAVGRSDHAGGVLAMLAIEGALGRWLATPARVEAARRLRAAFDEALGAAVLVHPVYPRAAPLHRGFALRDPRDVGCTALFNLTESPVTVVRVSTDRAGLPIGVQLVGARGRDAAVLAAAEALERVFGVPAPVQPESRPATTRADRPASG